MSLSITDLKFYQSSNGNLGGSPDFANEVDISADAFWDNISASESTLGDVEYRCMYARNVSTTNSLLSPSVELTQNAIDADTTMAIAVLDDVNTNTVSIADESTEPAGSPTWQAVGVDIQFNTDLAFEGAGAGDYIAIWIRRTVVNSVNQAANDNCSITLKGQTSA